jgi:hypothetical protein
MRAQGIKKITEKPGNAEKIPERSHSFWQGTKRLGSLGIFQFSSKLLIKEL